MLCLCEWLWVEIKPLEIPLRSAIFYLCRALKFNNDLGRKNTNQRCHDSIWLDSIPGSYKHKSTAASPCCKHTEETLIPKVGIMKRTGGEADTCFIYDVFSTITAVLKSEENTIFVLTMVDQIRLIQFWHDKVIWWTQGLAEREHSFKLGMNSSSA